MLARKYRIFDKKDFDRVQKEGKVYQSESFGMALFNRKDNDPSRFGFIVSTKISKDAVDRNRFKRTLNEGVRLVRVELINGFDVVFLAKTSISRVPTSEVMKEVRLILINCGLLK